MGLFDIFKKENKENKKAIFISNAGGMIITKSLLEGKSKLKWIFRENSTNAADNGWRAIGDTDTQEYINNRKNMTVVDFNTFANIEPAILAIYNLPVGTDLEFHIENGKRYFVDTQSGKVIG